MLILPLIDLLILFGSGSLLIGFVLKSINITTHYDPEIFGFSSIDFVLMAGICLGFSLTLAARTWVKLNEPKLHSHSGSLAWVSRKGKKVEPVGAEEDSEEEFEVPLVDAASGARRR